MGKRFVVEDSFWQVFPDVEIGVLCVDGIKPTDQIGEEEAKAAAKFLDRANASAEEWLTSSAISQNEVVAVWRDAYRKFKTKKGARCSVENLLKRVLKDNPVGHIVPSVDVSNAISLKYALPIGAEESDPTLPGEIAYLDDAGAVCRCWNWRDGQRTEVSDATPHCMFIMENVMPERSADLHAAIDELAEKCEQLLGATVTNKDFVTREHPETELV